MRKPNEQGSIVAATKTVAQARANFLAALRTTLIPNAENYGFNNLALGLPPVVSRGNIAIADSRWSRGDPRSLVAAGYQLPVAAAVANTPEQMVVFQFPRFVFVLEGEADLRLGVTAAMRREHFGIPPRLRSQIVSLGPGSALLIPAGVAMDDTAHHHRYLHWYRPEPRPNARLFWLIVLPSGLLVHICECRVGKHSGTPELLANDSGLLTQTELLIDDLMAQEAGRDVPQNRLLTLLLRVRQMLETERWFLQPAGITLPGSEGRPVQARLPATAGIFQRARVYIEANLHEKLAPATIARHVAVSTVHLNRIFRAEAGTSVMRYVAAQRVAVAKSLLTQSKLPINEVARYVGLPDPVLFNQVFSRATGQSPLAYRKAYSARAVALGGPHRRSD